MPNIVIISSIGYLASHYFAGTKLLLNTLVMVSARISPKTNCIQSQFEPTGLNSHNVHEKHSPGSESVLQTPKTVSYGAIQMG